ncbi:MAG: o-succinylbenzoate--CoA ligase [Candidatus Hydrogenedentes bacterium]|nr:o-succinylbenzoate--CoA ligase [Candidatus Hydrogenedentota bacterium]
MPSVPCPIESRARDSGDSAAVATSRGIRSYRQFHAQVSRVQAELTAGPVRAGTRVALRMPVSEDCVVLFWALLRAGALVCPISMRWPEDAVRSALAEIGCNFVLRESVPAEIAGDEGVGDREDALPAADRPVHHFDAERLATVVSTSGSTGTPKAVLHRFGSHYVSAQWSNRNLPLTEGDRWLLSLPLYHVSGIAILFRCALAGAALVIPDIKEDIAETIARYAVTHVSLVPTQLYRLLQTREGREALGRLRVILVGGGPVPPPLIHEAASLNLPIFTTYGLTEMASQVTTTRHGDSLEHLLSCGCALDANSIMSAPDGEILVRGDTLFAGYLQGDAAHLPLTADGWFATGDLGRFDEDGYLHVLGRKDNMFISGGENVYPEEIEKCLCQVSGIEEAVVVPVEDEEFGQLPVAFVRTAGDTPLTPTAIKEHLARTLPRFKIPKRLLAWPKECTETGLKRDRCHFLRLAHEQPQPDS